MFCHLHCLFKQENSAKAALSAVRMDREVLAGVVRLCAVHNGRTTDGDKLWMEREVRCYGISLYMPFHR